MRAVVQRVENASVAVAGRITGRIDTGLLIYVGIGKHDAQKDAVWLAGKIADMRIFPDEEYKMNYSVRDIGGAILAVSQFTLYADMRKGRRPSYDKAASPEVALELYEQFIACLRATGLRIETGEYQAVMDVSYINKGPVTILLDTEAPF
ncbi:MAG: D-tyrosyl-tRNA(Tyr) deacylase [Calothrix sp. SM1_5_4]|nr:D-tyrosyl-tRNA(Tyr) deacylase [Calothrix sp. SM1_5_4]